MTLPGDGPSPWSREGQYPPPPYPPASPPPYPLPKPYPPAAATPPPTFYPPPPPAPYPQPPARRRVGRWVALGVVGAVVVGLAMWGVIADNRSHSAGSTSTPTSGQSSVVSGDTKVVTANDQKSQLTVPASWKDVPASFKNELASLQLGDARQAQYVIVVSASIADFDDFPAFAEACLEEARQLVEGAEISQARSLTVGGLNAVQHQVAGKATGIKIAFWYTMVEGKRGFYEVVGWTTPSKKAEAEPTILKVIDSFRELNGG